MIIEINSKQVGIKFNNYAFEQLIQLKGLDKTAFGFVYGLVYAGYEGWRFVRQNLPGYEEPALSFENIVDWVDESVNDESIAASIRDITAEYQKSQLYLKTIKNAREEKKSLEETVTTEI